MPESAEAIAQTSNVFGFAIAFITGLFAFLAAWATSRSALAKAREADARARSDELKALREGEGAPGAIALLTLRVDELARKIEQSLNNGTDIRESLIELRSDLRVMLEILRRPSQAVY